MPSTREQIYSALFALTAAIGPTPGSGLLKTRSRILQHWEEVERLDQPALFQIQKRETMEQAKGRPTMRRFQIDWLIYCNRGEDETITPSTQINNVIDAVEALFQPPVGEDAQTLGGIVSHAWIGGTIETDEGLLGPQAIAIIPIEILVPIDYTC